MVFEAGFETGVVFGAAAGVPPLCACTQSDDARISGVANSAESLMCFIGLLGKV
jgi:hypothetical protein